MSNFNQAHKEFRQFSPYDRMVNHADRVLRTLAPRSKTGSPAGDNCNPAKDISDTELNEHEKRISIGLMRVNHTGEVCAQALYQGQALTAKLDSVKNEMDEAAKEEEAHLTWCASRLNDFNSHPSVLNPLWYGLSFSMGAAAGLISDKVSLGFVAAVEDQVCKHLEEHLEELPEQDLKSRSIVTQMLKDEARHAETAIQAGGIRFPAPVKSLMTLTSKLMTQSSYRI